MARKVSVILVIAAIMSVLAGCNEGVNSGKGQIIPPSAKDTGIIEPAPKAEESDMIEQMAVNRQAYRQRIESLIEYYTKTGDNMKLEWAKKELAAIDTMPQYKYVIDAGVAGPNLKANATISDADKLYEEAVALDNKARLLFLVINDNMLRQALDKYNRLIKEYPTSDKIDDAVYMAAQIYEHFQDYSIAVLYYQRTYQWDPETTYPARFKAAYILDRKLARRAEALELYKEAVQREEGSIAQIDFAKMRIDELTAADRETIQH